MKFLITILLAVLIGGGGTFFWLYYGGFEKERSEAIAFIDIYGDYNDAAEKVEFLVHLPGTENNVDRSELLSLLNSILTEDMEPERRESLARLAYSNLDSLKDEIEAAKVAQEDLYSVLQDLDSAVGTFKSMELQGKAGEIVLLSRKRAEVSARIASALSETNEHTHAIITRILSEKGALSHAHIVEINSATESAEDRFVMLESLYSELMRMKAEVDTLFAEFVQIAL